MLYTVDRLQLRMLRTMDSLNIVKIVGMIRMVYVGLGTYKYEVKLDE